MPSSRTSPRSSVSALSLLLIGAVAGCGGSSSGDGPGASAPGAEVTLPGTGGGEGAADGTGSALYADGRNSARLEGPVFGAGSVEDALLARALPFSVDRPEESVRVSAVHVVRDPRGSRIVGVIENRSSDFRCLMSVDGLMLRDADDRLVPGGFGILPVFGAIGTLRGLESDGCAAPGSSVYFLLYSDLPAERVRGVSIESTSSDVGNFALFDARVEPVSYELAEGGNLSILLANRSAIVLTVRRAEVVILDAAGSPLGTGNLGAAVDVRLAPGEERAVTTMRIDGFEGRASTIRPVLHFTAD